MQYQPGRVIVRRGMHPDGRIGAVQAGRVAADNHDGLLLWVDAGSAMVRRTSLDEVPTRALPVRAELGTCRLCSPRRRGGRTGC